MKKRSMAALAAAIALAMSPVTYARSGFRSGGRSSATVESSAGSSPASGFTGSAPTRTAAAATVSGLGAEHAASVAGVFRSREELASADSAARAAESTNTVLGLLVTALAVVIFAFGLVFAARALAGLKAKQTTATNCML